MISQKEPKSKHESLDTLLLEKKITKRTYQRVINAKKYIERKYNMIKIKKLQSQLINQKIINSDLSSAQKEEIKNAILNRERLRNRKLLERQSIRDYNHIKIIGKGSFGEVHVCQSNKTGEVVAIKKIKKTVLYKKNQIKHTKDEQFFLSKINSPWIVNLKSSFQQGDYLYLVMEYLPGGDLMSLLMKVNTLSENQAKFYLCEMILAIESIHRINCIHRDIKPDNILIDKNGHIKLSDFGLAKISDKIFQKNEEPVQERQTHRKNYSCVGTAYYVAPEVLNKQGYGQEIDWWSVGVIFFEMLVGYAPFFSKDTADVCYKILNWQRYLKIPSNITVSKEAEDLIKKMINNSNIRLGKNGADEIKAHPFFKGIDWENIRKTVPPFIPELKNDYDVSYFETFEVKEPFYPPQTKHKKRKDIEYIGYTYKGDDEEAENSSNYVTEILDSIKAGKNEEEANKISSTDSPQKIPIKTDKVINTSPMISPAQKKIQIIQLPLKKIKVDGEDSNLSDRTGSGKKISTTSSNTIKTKVLRKSPSPKRQINLNKSSSPGKGIKKESKEIKK